MKKYIVVCTILYLIFSAYILYSINLGTTYVNASASSKIKLVSKVSGKDILINNYGKWNKTYIKGVDLGAGKPGAFPGNFAISKQEYIRWFKQISDMNANTIRVYTILSPDFYDAFYSYNESHIKKLCLIQGVWVNENTILEKQDAFSPAIIDKFKQDTLTAIDVIHGNKTIPKVQGEASGNYSRNVSKWVIGYILGIEWDGEFIKKTNELHPEITGYNGKYLKTVSGSPYESFLAQVGDHAITYETQKYKQQRLLAFSNWPTTDPLLHSAEEDSVNFAQLDVEHIKATDNFYSGQFASYHVYPYYPDFFDFQKEYMQPSPKGEINSYKVYLSKLNSYHTLPVVISEYGVPSSRGIARIESHNGFNQGNLTEKRQGEIIAELTNIIHDSGCAGGLIFAWQDEWFKRTWNTSDFNLRDYRAFWSDFQTNEQSFGLLSFDPGKKNSRLYVDGDVSEWSKKDVLMTNNDLTLYAKSDEKFLYFRVNKPNFNPANDKILLPIDITPKSGITGSKRYNAKFERSADFLISIDGKASSRFVVHDYFDVFTYKFSDVLFKVNPHTLNYKKDSGDFVNSYLALRFPLRVESTGKYSAPSYFDTGYLTYGNTNPKSSEFNSIADFCIKGDDIEIRIPWALMNIMDPSNKKIMDDFYALGSISPQSIDKLYIGVSEAGLASEIKMSPFSWKSWEEPNYHERLKESYPVVQKIFEQLK